MASRFKPWLKILLLVLGLGCITGGIITIWEAITATCPNPGEVWNSEAGQCLPAQMAQCLVGVLLQDTNCTCPDGTHLSVGDEGRQCCPEGEMFLSGKCCPEHRVLLGKCCPEGTECTCPSGARKNGRECTCIDPQMSQNHEDGSCSCPYGMHLEGEKCKCPGRTELIFEEGLPQTDKCTCPDVSELVLGSEGEECKCPDIAVLQNRKCTCPGALKLAVGEEGSKCCPEKAVVQGMKCMCPVGSHAINGKCTCSDNRMSQNSDDGSCFCPDPFVLGKDGHHCVENCPLGQKLKGTECVSICKKDSEVFDAVTGTCKQTPKPKPHEPEKEWSSWLQTHWYIVILGVVVIGGVPFVVYVVVARNRRNQFDVVIPADEQTANHYTDNLAEQMQSQSD